MTRQPEQANAMAALLRSHREQIVSNWAEAAFQLPGARYCKMPRRELLAAGGRWLDFMAEAPDSEAFPSIESSLADITRIHMRQGFHVGEVSEALLLLRETVLPHLEKSFSPGSLQAYEAAIWLDRCVCRTISSFGAIYTEAMRDETLSRLAESESLRRVASALLEKMDLGDVLEIVCTEAKRLTGALGSTVFLLEDEDWLGVARSTVPQWPVCDRIPVEGTFTGMVVRQGKAGLTNDPTGEQWRYPGHILPTALLAAPLNVKGAAIGALDVVNKPGGFTMDDLRIIGLFADQAAIAIENARLHRQAEQLAVLQERQRLAQELHDSVTQSVYSVTLFAEAAVGLLAAGDHDRAAVRLARLRDTAQDALREMRLLIFELHPPVLEEVGLVGALQARLETVETRAGVQTRLEVDGEGRLPIAMEEDLYRIVHEALNNVLKHARAQMVVVRLRLTEEEAHLEVSDDGIGFDPSAPAEGGLGLAGVRERAKRLGARLSIDSAPGKGTRLAMTMPSYPPDLSGGQYV